LHWRLGSAITINAHPTEVASCTDDEQRRVMTMSGEEVGDTLPVIHGARGGASAAGQDIRRGN
jgi:4-hydroxy-tetrahydrodipicolinate synthase